MLRALKFAGSLAINLVIAVVASAIADAELGQLIRPHSMAALVWKECALSIAFAAFIGFGVWLKWPNSAARWTWVIPAVWFSVGLVATAGGRSSVFGPLFMSSSRSVLVKPEIGKPEIRSFFAFTIPLIRGISYSVGAYISSVFYPLRVANPQ